MPAPQPLYLSAAAAAELQASRQLKSLEELAGSLIAGYAKIAQPPTSKYFVGAVAIGSSGALYGGVNIEIEGSPINGDTLHGEQSAIINALNHAESRLAAVVTQRGCAPWVQSNCEGPLPSPRRTVSVTVGVVSQMLPSRLVADPCGHCRQFMCELSNAEQLLLLSADGGTRNTLAAALPGGFFPGALGVGAPAEAAPRLLAGADEPTAAAAAAVASAVEAAKATESGIDAATFDAAAEACLRRSHAPYQPAARAGLALRCRDGSVHRGGRRVRPLGPSGRPPRPPLTLAWPRPRARRATELWIACTI